MIGLAARMLAFRLACVSALLVVGPGEAGTDRVYRIGLLLNAHLADGANDFTAELERLGYVEGRNLVLDWRLVTSAERNAMLAAELVAAKPDILLAAGSQSSQKIGRSHHRHRPGRDVISRCAAGTPVVRR